MRSPKFFLACLSFVAIILFVIDIPFPLNFGKVKLPIINNTLDLNIDTSRLNLNLGFLNVQKDLSYKLGLDLQGGTSIVYQVDMKGIPSDQQDAAFESARSVIERRVNFFGVTEPTIQALKLPNEYRIIVDLPGATEIDQALDLIGKTAQLTFWEEGREKMATADAMLLPLGLAQIYQNKPTQTKLTGKDLKSAAVVYGSADGTPQVQLKFSSEGVKIFGEITQRNLGKQVAIVLDNMAISAPVVQAAILNGDAVISGSFTQEAAKNLAIQLNAGALPAPLKVIGQSTVGPSLGIDSLKKSLVGGVVGFISLVIFMIFLYKKEGVLASTALLIYAIIVLFIFKAVPVTLTLAGIAGFILSVGMAVDANVLIFERMKEELRQGKPKEIAVRLGFSRAWPSIRDSNVSSIMTTLVLFYFGSGIIRGFAVALFIGIVVSMFSAILVTRNLLALFERDKK